MSQGFSLTEVLVSLVLICSTSLALLKQQWQVTHLFNHMKTRADVLLQLDNVTEQRLAGFTHVPLPGSLEVHQKKLEHFSLLEINGLLESPMRRHVVVD